MKKLIALFAMLATLSAHAEIAATAESVHPLQPPAKLPNVMVTRMDGSSVTLPEALGGKPTVLVIYRGGWCPYCSRQLSGLQETLPALQQHGYQVIALSPDPVDQLSKTAEKEKLSYTLLSDHSFAAIEALGLAFALDAETLQKYEGYHVPLYSPLGSTAKALPVPAVFLIDASGAITFTHSNPDYTKRLSTDDLLKAAGAN